jgi:hypothetical protein
MGNIIMSGRYKQVSLEQAAPGMVLAGEVCDRQGNVLLANGTALTDTLLQALARRGVDSVRVEDDALSPEQLADLRERVEQRLAHLFRNPHPGAANALLREQISAYRMEPLQ